MAGITVGSALLSKLRNCLMNMVVSGQYQIGDNWYTSGIDLAEIRQNGAVYIAFMIEAQDEELTPATHFRLLSSDEAVLAEREEEVPFTENMPSLVYRFKFEITAEEEEDAE